MLRSRPGLRISPFCISSFIILTNCIKNDTMTSHNMKQLPIHQRITPRQKSILLLVTKLPQISNKDILKKLRAKFGDIARITLIRDLNYLKEQQYISRIGEGRSVGYVPFTDDTTPNYNNHIPENLKRYFWDTDVAKLSLKKHATYIIERVLEWGNIEAVKWLRDIYAEKTILQVLNHSRRISDKSTNFWRVIFSSNNILPICTPKSSERKQEKIWKY